MWYINTIIHHQYTYFIFIKISDETIHSRTREEPKVIFLNESVLKYDDDYLSGKTIGKVDTCKWEQIINFPSVPELCSSSRNENDKNKEKNMVNAFYLFTDKYKLYKHKCK